jgi:hypothetical protein
LYINLQITFHYRYPISSVHTAPYSTTSLTMANFMDLPKAVRQKIYRLHLVADDQPVTFEAYKQFCGSTATIGDYERMDLKTLRDNGVDTSKDGKSRTMPALLQVNGKIEVEAAEVYYGENAFAFTGPGSLYTWKYFMLPHHLKLLRKVVLLRWTRHAGAAANDAFRKLSALRQLESLTVAVNERLCLAAPHTTKWHPSLGFGRQIALQAYRLEGITGLRSLRGLPDVKFVKGNEAAPFEDPADVGIIPGGFLETTIKHEMMLSRSFDPQKTNTYVRTPKMSIC